MKIDIDNVCSQIINIQVDNGKEYILKDIKLDLEECEQNTSMNYEDAYYYLRDCLLMDDSCRLLDVFLVHQYLCHCYLCEDTIHNLYNASDDWSITKLIVRECFSSYRKVGAFQACVNQYEILRKSVIWDDFKSAEKLHIMKEAAKSYRNIGKFGSALELYYECLKMNSESEQAWLERVELLLKIGKVYRNYLMQIELAKFFVEEAERILQKNRTHVSKNKNELRYTIICLDTLGQIYRDEGKYNLAEKCFKESEILYGKKGGRAYFHEILMKYKKEGNYTGVELEAGIADLADAIKTLEANPMDEVGIGIRSVQLGHLKFMNESKDKSEAYAEIWKGRKVALKYNDMKTVIRSYREEADFCRKEGKFADYVKISRQAVKIASDSNQLMLENEIIKDIISFSDEEPELIDSATKRELIKRRKDIFAQLVGFSKYSIGIVRDSGALSFSEDRLIDIYKIVFDDFEQILWEMGSAVEILNKEIEKIDQKYLAYLNTETKGFTYKSILHKFKNDLPNESIMIRLKDMCDDIQRNNQSNNPAEYGEILTEASHQLEMFAQIISHIKQSADEALKESCYEKEWCSLYALIQAGIQNFFFSKPQYVNKVYYSFPENEVNILVQRPLFETTITEILNNAFSYMETIENRDRIEECFGFFLNVEMIGKRAVVMKCYSQYPDDRVAEKAIESIKKGMALKSGTVKEGSRYGFYSIKFLFGEVMGGKTDILYEERKAGISIQLPIDLVTVQIAERD